MLAFFLVGINSLSGQVTKEKNISESYTGKEIVVVRHSHGPIFVAKSNTDEVKLDIKISVEAKSEQDAQTVLDNFKVDLTDFNNRLTIESEFELKSQISDRKGTRYKFKNGTVVKNASGIKALLTLYVPSLEQLDISNRYQEVVIADDLTKDLFLNLHAAKVDIGNIQGTLETDLKYSKGKIGNFKNGKLKFFDCDLQVGAGHSLEMESKYSDIKLKEFKEVSLDCYDDDIEMGNVEGDLRLVDKYSEFELGNFKNGRMDLYDSDLEMENGKDIQLKSKYSELRFNKLNDLNFELSFDDDVYVESMNTFNASESKYSKYNIKTLGSKLSMNSFDDNVYVSTFVGPLLGLDFKAKYSDLKLEIPSETVYEIDATVHYGKLEFPEDKFTFKRNKTISNKREFSGSMKEGATDLPSVVLDLFDCKVELQ